MSNASLKLTDDNSEAASVRGQADRKHAGKTATYLYGIPAGRYFWDLDLSTCERWEIRLESIQHAYAPEPEAGTVTRSGKDTLDTTPFVLTGGDYTVAMRLKSGAGDCDLDAYLIPVADYDLFSSVGDVSVESPKRKTVNDESQIYAVPADRYYWSVKSSAFAVGLATCDWTLTIRPQ